MLLCDFLLRALDGAYRAPFAKLLERFHQGWASRKSFDSCFSAVDRRMLQRDWLWWLGNLDVEDRE